MILARQVTPMNNSVVDLVMITSTNELVANSDPKNSLSLTAKPPVTVTIIPPKINPAEQSVLVASNDKQKEILFNPVDSMPIAPIKDSVELINRKGKEGRADDIMNQLSMGREITAEKFFEKLRILRDEGLGAGCSTKRLQVAIDRLNQLLKVSNQTNCKDSVTEVRKRRKKSGLDFGLNNN